MFKNYGKRFRFIEEENADSKNCFAAFQSAFAARIFVRFYFGSAILVLASNHRQRFERVGHKRARRRACFRYERNAEVDGAVSELDSLSRPLGV